MRVRACVRAHVCVCVRLGMRVRKKEKERKRVDQIRRYVCTRCFKGYRRCRYSYFILYIYTLCMRMYFNLIDCTRKKKKVGQKEECLMLVYDNDNICRFSLLCCDSAFVIAERMNEQFLIRLEEDCSQMERERDEDLNVNTLPFKLSSRKPALCIHYIASVRRLPHYLFNDRYTSTCLNV